MQLSSDTRSMKQPDKTGIESPWKCMRAGRSALLIALVFAVCTVHVSAREAAGKNLKVFYQQNCAVCHGPDGSAVTAEGKELSGRDFTDTDWRRSTQDDKMVETILKGKFFGWAMPSFKDTLTPEEARRIVTEIIRKSKKGRVIVPDKGD
ncbi:MAG: c-type cytochrome [Thermodesulfobacteriota bacterium]